MPINLIFLNRYPVSCGQVVIGAWLLQNASWKGQSGTDSVAELSTHHPHICTYTQVLLKAERQPELLVSIGVYPCSSVYMHMLQECVYMCLKH